jgi:glycosyltransferase involved in cell wall biosynthesis
VKKVTVVGTVGLPSCYGGFESLVENLTNHSSDSIGYIVFCSSKSYVEKKTTHNGAQLVYLPLNANGAQSIPYDIWSLIKCWWLKPDTVLILGVSGCIFLPIFRFLSNSKVITNIDGLEWKREKWGGMASKFLKFSEFLAVRYSDIVVADNQAITNYVLEEYGVTAATIAYGGDHALLSHVDNVTSDKDYSLALCRIEPENNVEMILKAFSKTKRIIKFIGNWDGSEFGRKLKERYSCFENIEIIEPIYDLKRLFDLRVQCKNYIHGHSAGGTNPSLVEMMHFGKPVFCFDCDFNRYSTENKAFYFSSVESLIENVEKVNNDPSVGKDMSEIAGRRYTWKEVVSSYESLY